MSPPAGDEHRDVVERLRLADRAYDVIRGRILRGELLSGSRLSVPKLADELGLSRSPVREAVQRVVAEGLGEEEIHRGVVVATVDDAELTELTELRARLEGYAAGRAARLAGSDPGMVRALASALARHEAAIAADDAAGVIAADMEFHLLLAGPGTPTARAVLPLLGRAQLLMLAGDLSRWPQLACVEHRDVLDAVRAGEPAAAEAAIRDHVERIRDRHRSR